MLQRFDVSDMADANPGVFFFIIIESDLITWSEEIGVRKDRSSYKVQMETGIHVSVWKSEPVCRDLKIN